MLKKNLAIAAILSLSTACANDASESHRANLSEDPADVIDCESDADCDEGQLCVSMPPPECLPDEPCAGDIVYQCVDEEDLPLPIDPTEPTEPTDPNTPDYCPGCGLG